MKRIVMWLAVTVVLVGVVATILSYPHTASASGHTLFIVIDISGSLLPDGLRNALEIVATQLSRWISLWPCRQVCVLMVDDPRSVWMPPQRQIEVKVIDSVSIRRELRAAGVAEVGIAGKRKFDSAVVAFQARIVDSVSSVAEYIRSVQPRKAECSAITETAYRLSRLQPGDRVIYLTDLQEECITAGEMRRFQSLQGESTVTSIVIGYVPSQSDGSSSEAGTEIFLKRKQMIERLLPQCVVIPYYELQNAPYYFEASRGGAVSISSR